MPQDICLRERPSERAPVVPTRFAIVVVALAFAVLAVVSLSDGTPVSPADTSVDSIEDWHGNVMRAQ